MKRLVATAVVAVIAGFAVGRSTVPNIVIGADPEEFEALSQRIVQLEHEARSPDPPVNPYEGHSEASIECWGADCY